MAKATSLFVGWNGGLIATHTQEAAQLRVPSTPTVIVAWVPVMEVVKQFTVTERSQLAT
ncbi:MAG: hypothetical protein VKK97_05545 [Synechococcaceae cyanobacterium]|nr:hypothetical protein [Synechococcaceae cyanobacterium]